MTTEPDVPRQMKYIARNYATHNNDAQACYAGTCGCEEDLRKQLRILADRVWAAARTEAGVMVDSGFAQIGKAFVAAIAKRQAAKGYPTGLWTVEVMLRTVEQAADAWSEKLPASSVAPRGSL